MPRTDGDRNHRRSSREGAGGADAEAQDSAALIAVAFFEDGRTQPRDSLRRRLRPAGFAQRGIERCVVAFVGVEGGSCLITLCGHVAYGAILGAGFTM